MEWVSLDEQGSTNIEPADHVCYLASWIHECFSL